MALHAGLVPGLRADGNSVPGGIAGIAAAEAQKRQGQVEAAQTLFTAGSKAYADQSYAEAMDYFKAAFETGAVLDLARAVRRPAPRRLVLGGLTGDLLATAR